MSKQTLIWVVIVALAAYGIWMVTKDNGSTLGENASPSPSASVSPVTAATKSTSKTTGSGTASGTTVSYNDILNQYKGRMIQFNAQCQATPGQMSLKAGEKILIDNRSADSKTIKLDSDTYALAGYNWRVITVKTTKALPYNLGIDCKSVNGTTENSAVIKLQANISNGL